MLPGLLIASLLLAAPASAAPAKGKRPAAAKAKKAGGNARPATAKPKSDHDTPVDPAVAAALRDRAGGEWKRFYAARGYRPLWVAGTRLRPAAASLIAHIAGARGDGLKPSSYDLDALREATERAGGDPAMLADAEVALTRAFVKFVRDQRRPRDKETIWADLALKAARPDTALALRALAAPPSIDAYVADMAWMSPLYVRLRTAYARAQEDGADEAQRERLSRNLERARILPGMWTRHVEVDASSGRLWYYEGGKQVGTMRAVVGTAETPTPMLAGTLQWAILNPYWNVPDYLAQKKVAPRVLAGRSLASMRMEALTDWSADARVIPASQVDWQAVADGTQVVRLRELPGSANSMGRVKFVFVNKEGIYLHDTPNRALLAKEDRHFSNGCIRLEDAAALGRWLLRKPLPARVTKEREKALPLPQGVPVYLTYLTAQPEGSAVTFRPDVYGRDG